MEWKNIYRGFIMGIADLIPGVSGGTLAVILGIYDRFLTSISGFFSKEWRKHIGFLIPLVFGMGSALLLLSKVIKYMLANFAGPTQFFFLGLVIGVLPVMFKQADVKKNFKIQHYILLIAAVALLAILASMRSDRVMQLGDSLSLFAVIGLFFSGWLASMAMLLPGISGSFILLVLGVYPIAINALSAFDVPIMAAIGTGVIIGFIVSSKAIRYALTHFPQHTYAVIIGLIIGSVFVVFPGVPSGSMIFISMITFVSGLLLTIFLGARDRT